MWKEDNLSLMYSSSAFSRKYSSPSMDQMRSFKPPFLKHCLAISRKRLKAKPILVSLLATFLIYIQLTCGVFQRYFLEIDFSEFSRYPAELEDFRGTIMRYMASEDRQNFQPRPVNLNYTYISFLENATKVLSSKQSVGLLVIVKSATKNFKRRSSIRRTWGDENYLQGTFMTPHLPTKVVFICGTDQKNVDGNADSDLFSQENIKYGDIILADFHDAYGNNTYKTILAMRWAIEYTTSFEYLMIVDDDMYVSPKNAIDFIKSIPLTTAQIVTSADTGVQILYLLEDGEKPLPGEYVPMKDRSLIVGQVCVDAAPFRNIIGAGSQWSIRVDVYPYSYFPPYAAGGATILDSSTVAQIYYASTFTKHFWIDDVYIGMVAHKLGIRLTHSNLVDSSYKGFLGRRFGDKFEKMIAIHGLSCPEQLVELWHSRKIGSLSDCEHIAHLLP